MECGTSPDSDVCPPGSVFSLGVPGNPAWRPSGLRAGGVEFIVQTLSDN